MLFAGSGGVTDYVTSWWKKIGETEWRTTPSGLGRSKSSIFECVATGERRESGQLPIGALYANDRGDEKDRNGWPPAGDDGLSIVCVCIGDSGPDSRHHWYIDYRASNCTKPDDEDHRCWVRHGTFGEKLTVDKNGNTCGAGAGSFYMDNRKWHGFLTRGIISPRRNP
jgi:hypothetical protein